MTRRPFCIVALLLLAAAAAARTASAQETKPDPTQLEFFEKKVRPLLVENCHQCHSAAQKQRGGLALDSRAALLRGGDTGPVLVPGQPEKSRLIQAIGYQDVDLRMPPKGRLTDEQIEVLTTWVKMGTPWPDGLAPGPGAGKQDFDLHERKKHWAWQPLQPAVPPAVKRGDWPRSPVDAFILARLEAAGLAPTRPADKRTLIRRVTYDLTGLPPTPAEIDAFLADDTPGAFERVVERLLASPHYGERWGRHWLDLVRFAETAGHEFDFDMPLAHRYRDYVIRAFNQDFPYDRFVIEHVAGDLLDNPRRHPTERFNEAILGTGFWFLHESKHSPVDIRADEAERIDNQIDVFSKAFLGLTVSCARCHDHKFDAISTKDYYALAGYLRSSRYQDAFISAPEPAREAVRRLRDLQEQARPIAIDASARGLKEQADGLARQFLGDPQQQEVRKRLAGQATVPAAPSGSSVDFEEFNKDGYPDWFVTGDAFGSDPSRVGEAVLQAGSAGPVKHVIGPGLAHSGLVSLRLQGALRSKTFTIEKKKVLYRVAGRGGQINLIIDGFQRIRDPIYGGLTLKIDHGDRLEWRVQDVSMWLGHTAYVEILDDGPGYVAVDQVLFSDDGPPADVANPLLLRELGDLAGEAALRRCQELFREITGQWQSGRLESAERVAVLNWMLQHVSAEGPAKGEAARLAALLDAARELEAGLPEPLRAMAMADGTGVDERVFIRGSHKNLGEVVPRRFLEAIAGRDHTAPARGSGRLELARRMVDPSNPLLTRVMVNRIWQHHFGEGIVRSPDNFGALGEPPTHPELLDYLAAEFVRSGWSVKRLHRLMLLSSTYQMASKADDPAAEERDSRNQLLHRMPIRRLEAEAIRDAILAVSGRLDRMMEGPGVPPHLTPFMSGRGRPRDSGPLDGAGRRSVYLNVRRNFLTPMFLAFDYPIPFTTIGKRSVSNVPAQALTLMNNPFVVQQAERWAKRVLAERGLSPEQRIVSMYVAAFGRQPTEVELANALAFVKEQDRADDLRVWADLGHVLINVKEFIFIN